MNARWAITRPVSIHRHSSVHKIVPKLASTSSITPYLYLRIFAGEISLRFNLNLRKFVQSCKISTHAAANKICMLSDILFATCWYSSEPWHCFTTSSRPAVNFRSVMAHLQPNSHTSQFGKRILHLVSETKVNTKMCTQGLYTCSWLTDEQ